MEARDYFLELVRNTKLPIFLTGKAGTGKTTLLRQLIRETYKNYIVAAPTGIAALNAEGVTLHSLFQIPPGVFLPEEPRHGDLGSLAPYLTPRSYWRQSCMQSAKRKLLQELELLVIDEVSMLRADLLDVIDMILKHLRSSQEPFGGVQVVFIGDLLQLPPVVGGADWAMLSSYYEGMYFFQARSLRGISLVRIELTTVFRQEDEHFICLLNQLRTNSLTKEELEELNSHVRPHFDPLKEDGYIVLTTHNDKAERLNRQALERLTSPSYYFDANVEGDFPDKLYPLASRLELKVGAKVMFTRNDYGRGRYYNGSIGSVVELSTARILVQLDDSEQFIAVEPHEWTNVQYTLDEQTGETVSRTLGVFRHYPLRLAWAITVHKSQGLTFDRVALDLSQAFSPGQAYVALSRLRSLSGLVLLTPLCLSGSGFQEDLCRFLDEHSTTSQLESILLSEYGRYWCDKAMEALDWSNLADAWRDHSFSYRSESGRSLKSHFGDWASETRQKVEEMTDVALRFRQQLYQLWSQLDPPFPLIADRLAKSLAYFTPFFGQIVAEIEVHLTSLEGQKRKSKAFRNELLDLRQRLVFTVRQLVRLGAIAEALASSKSLTRDNLAVEEKLLRWQEEVQQLVKSLATDTAETSNSAGSLPLKRSSVKRKSFDSQKESTQEVTLRLLLEGNTPEEVATIRKLSIVTILQHCAFLLIERKLSADKLFDLDEAQEVLDFLRSSDRKLGLKDIYEALDERYSYEQLKLYRAYYLGYVVSSDP